MLELKRIKIAADGSQLPIDYPGTDHIATYFPDHGVMIAVESIGSPQDPDKGMPQTVCEATCKALSLAGFTDWELALPAEAWLVRDDDFTAPAVDPNYFPRIKPEWHWTCKEEAGGPAFAWGVGLNYGGVYAYHRTYHGFGLAVRRLGQ